MDLGFKLIKNFITPANLQIVWLGNDIENIEWVNNIVVILKVNLFRLDEFSVHFNLGIENFLDILE